MCALRRRAASRDHDDVNIDDIRAARLPSKRADIVSLLGAERNDVAAAQKPS